MRGKISVVLASGVLILAGACVSAPAAAQSTKERLTALEQAVADLQARAPATADTAVRLGQLQEQIQELTGRIEELSYELERTQARLDAVSAALAGGGEGVGGLAEGPAAATGGPVALAPGGDPIADRIAEASGEESDVALPFDPDEAFSYASGFLLRGDYARAEEAFELYVEAFPNHPRTADAQFRLGEIYLATGKNADAADVFIAHIKKYPNDPRAAEAYLKLGTAFARLGQTSEACQVFKSMRSKFPSAPQPVRDRADLEMSRLNCR